MVKNEQFSVFIDFLRSLNAVAMATEKTPGP